MVAANTIGMIGLGNVGRALARRLAGWDGRLICYDPYVRQADADRFGVALVNPDTRLRSVERIANISTLRRSGRLARGAPVPSAPAPSPERGIPAGAAGTEAGR